MHDNKLIKSITSKTNIDAHISVYGIIMGS